MMKMNLKDVFEYLQSKDFMYKGKTITRRTIRTMFDKKLFNTIRRCECKMNRVVDFKEVNDLLKEFKDETIQQDGEERTERTNTGNGQAL